MSTAFNFILFTMLSGAVVHSLIKCLVQSVVPLSFCMGTLAWHEGGEKNRYFGHKLRICSHEWIHGHILLFCNHVLLTVPLCTLVLVKLWPCCTNLLLILRPWCCFFPYVVQYFCEIFKYFFVCYVVIHIRASLFGSCFKLF